MKFFLQYVWKGQMFMTDSNTTQVSDILRNPPVGLISHDFCDRVRLVRNYTVPGNLLSGKDKTLANLTLKEKIKLVDNYLMFKNINLKDSGTIAEWSL